MPVIRWTGIPDAQIAAKTVGPRLRHLRETRGLTLRELASRIDVSKNTILRLEHGLPIAEPIVHKICNALQTILPNLMVSESEWSRPVRIHRTEDSQWRIAFRRAKAPAIYKNFDPVEDERERTRLGKLGFVTGFLNTQNCSLRNGRLEAAIVEVHGHQEQEGFRHSGEEFVHCLSGKLKLTVGRELYELNPGDSATFFSQVRHRYECGQKGDIVTPTRFLMVWMEDVEDPMARQYDEECEAQYAAES